MKHVKTKYSLTISGLSTIQEPISGPIKTPEDVRSLCDDVAQMAQEAFVLITLNSKGALIDRHLITLGILNASLIHPRETFRVAISDSAASIIVAHNHPTGDPTPSPEDIRITRQLVQAGQIIDIRLQDHVILGSKDTFCSIRDEGLVDFN